MLILLVQDKKDVAGIGTLATQILQIYTDVSKSLYRHKKSEFSLFLQDSSKKKHFVLAKKLFLYQHLRYCKSKTSSTKLK